MGSGSEIEQVSTVQIRQIGFLLKIYRCIFVLLFGRYSLQLDNNYFYCMAKSVCGLDQLNPALLLATRASKMELACLARTISPKAI